MPLRNIVLLAPALALLAGAPARAAVKPLALADKDASIALAGDTALFAREGAEDMRVLAVPADGSARAATRLSVPVDGAADSIAVVAASGQRAAALVAGGDPDTQAAFTQEFSGPPAGPLTPLGPPSSPESAAPVPIFPVVDGADLFTVSTPDDQTFLYDVREGDAAPVALGLPATATHTRFAGDLAAYTDADGAVVTILDWRTGAKRTLAIPLEGSVETLALRADGTLAVDDGDGIVEYAPTGALTRISKTGEEPVFAGDRLVYEAGERLMIADPGAAPRPFGVPSATLGLVTADAQRVLWTANGCLLSAAVTDPPATAPDAGACPRSELTLDDGPGYAKLRRDRTLAFHAHCVAAPVACRGSFHLALFAPAHGRSAEIRFTIPAGASRRLVARFPRAAYAAARRAARNSIHEVTFDARGATVDPGGRRNPLDAGVMASPA